MATMKKTVPAKGMPKTMKAFEKSRFDKEPAGMKEGSAKDKKLDKKQFAALKSKK